MRRTTRQSWKKRFSIRLNLEKRHLRGARSSDLSCQWVNGAQLVTITVPHAAPGAPDAPLTVTKITFCLLVGNYLFTISGVMT
ncbi:hypothetical protein GN956_G16394 [Arapaima gigas]